MATAGYSGKPLIEKLGIASNIKVMLINAPANYFKLLESNINEQLTSKKIEADFVHVFVETKKELVNTFNLLIKEAPVHCVIWISWYKKSAKQETDVDENIIRAIVLPTGWVDVKVCAVSDIWSGLKIVKRKK